MKTNNQKVKTTYRLPSELKVKMLHAVEDHYGKKNKSKWINEAIRNLYITDVRLSSVGLGEHFEDQNETDVLLLEEDTLDILDSAMTKIRRQDPLYEGVRSAIIRAAIKNRLTMPVDSFVRLPNKTKYNT